jgi:hypothetical protein
MLETPFRPALRSSVSALPMIFPELPKFDRLQALFEHLRGLPETDWRHLIDRETEGDPEMRAGLERLLRAHGTFPKDADPREGGSFGPYRIVKELDRGGMGVVYEAVDERNGKTVALKIIRRDAAMDEEMRERFVREGRIAASVDHPNCVFVYGADVIANTPFIAMEIVSGKTLQQAIRFPSRDVSDWRCNSSTQSLTCTVEGSYTATSSPRTASLTSMAISNCSTSAWPNWLPHRHT